MSGRNVNIDLESDVTLFSLSLRANVRTSPVRPGSDV